MRGQRAVVGVDLGTSGVKVLVVGLGRRCARPPLGSTARGSTHAVLDRLPCSGAAGPSTRCWCRPSAGPSPTPADWWRATCRAVRQAVAQARDAEIVAVAVAGQMHGVVLTAAAPATPGPR